MRYLVPLLLAWVGLPAQAAHPGQEGQGHLAVAGDRFGPAEVTRVELHPEFERIHWEIDGVVPPAAEVVRAAPGRQGMCTHHGFTIFPRWDLAGERPWPHDPEEAWFEGEREPETPEEEAFEAACTRLAERGEGLVLGEAALPAAAEAGGTGEGTGDEVGHGGRGEGGRDAGVGQGRATATPSPPATTGRWTRSVVAPALWGGLFLAAALGLRRGRAQTDALREPLLLGLLALLARVVAGPWGLFNGAGAAWEKLRIAWDHQQSPDLYGQGLPALHGPGVALVGPSVDAVLALHLVLSVAAVPALWGLLRALHGAAAARLGALALAVLPLALWLSSTEVMLVPTMSLLVMAAACAAAPGPRAGITAGLLAGAAVHLRPEALLFLPAVAAVALVRPRATGARLPVVLPALLVGGGLVLARVLTLPELGAGGSAAGGMDLGPLDLRRLASLDALQALFLPAWDAGTLHHVALHWRWSSPVLLLAPAGLLLAGRRALPWLLWLLPTLVLLTKSWPWADALRLQLLLAPAWCALLGLVAARLLPLLPGSAVLRQGAFAGLVALPLLQGGPAFPHQAEWVLLREALPRLEPGRTLRVVDEARADKRAAVLDALQLGQELTVVPLSAGPVQEGELLLHGVACLVDAPSARDCALARRSCQWRQELAGITTPARTDLDAVLREDAVSEGRIRLSVFVLEGCGDEDQAPELRPRR